MTIPIPPGSGYKAFSDAEASQYVRTVRESIALKQPSSFSWKLDLVLIPRMEAVPLSKRALSKRGKRRSKSTRVTPRKKTTQRMWKTRQLAEEQKKIRAMSVNVQPRFNHIVSLPILNMLGAYKPS